MFREKSLNIFSYLFILFPLFLVTGPFIPDLYVVLSTFKSCAHDNGELLVP